MKKARIEPDEHAGLWLIIEGVKDEEVLWAISEDEVEPIMKACKEYITKNK